MLRPSYTIGEIHNIYKSHFAWNDCNQRKNMYAKYIYYILCVISFQSKLHESLSRQRALESLSANTTHEMNRRGIFGGSKTASANLISQTAYSRLGE